MNAFGIFPNLAAPLREMMTANWALWMHYKQRQSVEEVWECTFILSVFTRKHRSLKLGSSLIKRLRKGTVPSTSSTKTSMIVLPAFNILKFESSMQLDHVWLQYSIMNYVNLLHVILPQQQAMLTFKSKTFWKDSERTVFFRLECLVWSSWK